MTPSTFPIVLRCGPSGPPFDLAAAVAALGIHGSVCRVWSVPELPGGDVDVEVETPVLAYELVVNCDATQLGRCYVAWWNLLLEPEDDVEDPEPQPDEARGVIEAGASDTLQQSLLLGVKLQRRVVGESEVNSFPWIADGGGSVLIVPGAGPGSTCDPFIVGANSIKLLAEVTDVHAQIDGLRSCLTVVEFSLTATDAVRVDPSEPAP